MPRREIALVGLLLGACSLPNPTFVLATDGASSSAGETTTVTPDPTTGETADASTTGDASTITPDSDGQTATGDPSTGGPTTDATSEPLTSGSTSTGGDPGTGTTGDTTGDTTTGEPQLELPDCDPLDSSLLACYDFEYAMRGLPSELLDGSMYDHDGKVESATVIPGVEGTALEILDDGKIQVTPTNAFNYPTDSLTLTAWVRPSEPVRDQKQNGVLDKGPDFGLHVVGSGELVCRVGQASIEQMVEVPVGFWTHLACVYAAGDMTLYVDGAVVSSSFAADVEFEASMAPLAIGCADENCATATRFPGAIDGVRVWNAALKPQAICAAAGGADCL